MSKHEPTWNLYLQRTGEKRYKILMPDAYGEYTGAIPWEGFAVKWPVNPNFTGISGIRGILESTEQFAGAVIE
jgi:hypothetical protein